MQVFALFLAARAAQRVSPELEKLVRCALL